MGGKERKGIGKRGSKLRQERLLLSLGVMTEVDKQLP